MSQSNNKALGHIFPLFTGKFPSSPFFFFFEKRILFFFKASVKLGKAYKIKPVYECTRNINSFLLGTLFFAWYSILAMKQQSGYEEKVI